jgi:hypothetical protein
MLLRFGQIEQVLQLAHDIPADGESSFRARLRHLFRAGLSLPSGRVGRRANFHSADLFKMAFAVELLQAGILPERASLAVDRHWPDLVEQLFAGRAEWKTGKSTRPLLVANPHALTSPIYRFKPETIENLPQRLVEGRRLIVLDIRGLYARIVRAAEQVGIDMDALNASLDEDEAVILRDGAMTALPASGFIGDNDGDG